MAVGHKPYKIREQKIFEKKVEISNWLDSYYSGRSHGKKIEFLDMRIPTPTSKNKEWLDVIRKNFLDQSIARG